MVHVGDVGRELCGALRGLANVDFLRST